MRGTVCSLSEMTSTTLDSCGGQWSGSDWVFWCNEWLAEQHCWRDLSILSNFVLPEKEILWVTWFGFCSSLLSPLCHTGQTLQLSGGWWPSIIHHPSLIIGWPLTVLGAVQVLLPYFTCSGRSPCYYITWSCKHLHIVFSFALSFLPQLSSLFWHWGLCETRRVIKNNPKGCKGVKLMESVVFRDHDIYYFLHCKKNSTC